MFNSLKDARRYLEPKDFRAIHQTAVEAVKQFKAKETDLIKIIQQVDKNKVYRFIGLNSLFQYIVSLGLSESQALTYITVARKSLDCPELQKAVENQEITITKAKRICSVIDSRNQLQWIDLARKSNSRQLEKAVAKVNPIMAKPESARYINDHVLELNIRINEETFKMLEKVKALVSKKKDFSYNSDSALAEALKFYLDRHDPYYKAQRLINKKSKPSQKNLVKASRPVHVHCSDVSTDAFERPFTPEIDSDEPKPTVYVHCSKIDPDVSNKRLSKKIDPMESSMSNASSNSISKQPQNSVAKSGKKQELKRKSTARPTLPNKLKYKVYLRDQGTCQYKNETGIKCKEFRWLEVHHKLPVSQGGQDQLENLTTLCKSHHRLIHDR